MFPFGWQLSAGVGSDAAVLLAYGIRTSNMESTTPLKHCHMGLVALAGVMVNSEYSSTREFRGICDPWIFWISDSRKTIRNSAFRILRL